MAYGLQSEELRGAMSFPNTGLRAVDVPLDVVEYRVKDGIVTDSNGYTKDLGDGKGANVRAFQAVRSMVIFSDVDAQLVDVYQEPVPIQAGWNRFQGLPEISDAFKIDYGADRTDLEPAEAQTTVYLFNTPEIPLVADDLQTRATKDIKGETVDYSTYQRVFLQPVFPYDESTVYIKNTGANDVDLQINALNSGETFTETDNKTVSPGIPLKLTFNSPSELLEIKAKETVGGSSSTLDIIFVGESR